MLETDVSMDTRFWNKRGGVLVKLQLYENKSY